MIKKKDSLIKDFTIPSVSGDNKKKKKKNPYSVIYNHTHLGTMGSSENITVIDKRTSTELRVAVHECRLPWPLVHSGLNSSHDPVRTLLSTPAILVERHAWLSCKGKPSKNS